MNRKATRRILLASLVLLTLCTILCPRISYPKAEGQNGTRLAVVGFLPGLMSCRQAKVVRDPISGCIFVAEPVDEAYAEVLSNALYEQLRKRGDYELIPPVKARTMAMNLKTSGARDVENLVAQYAQVGKCLRADMVLVGFLYRWRERKGGAYGVRSPASVAFSVGLISVKDRSLIWNGYFDKTQRSLSENLLDIKTFLKAKGRWMTARELALLGLEKVTKEMPSPLGDKNVGDSCN